MLQLHLSVFTSLAATTVQPVTLDWPTLCVMMTNPVQYISKATCPLLKMATFGQLSTKKGSLRHDANVTAVCGIEGDHDAGTISPEQAAALLTKAGIMSIIYTTPSHTLTAPRWRVLVPLSRTYTPDARRALAARLNFVLLASFSPESFALSQAYYFGHVVGTNYDCRVTTGIPLDLVPNLLEIAPPISAVDHTGTFELSIGPVPEWRGPTDDADLLRRALQSGGAAAVFGQRATFAQLWNCDTEALRVAFPDPSHLYDASGADAALIAHLSFWTGKDGARIARLMRQSKLVREKWDREDYLPRSICEVLARPGGVLTDKLPEPPPGPAAVGIEAPAPVRKAGNTFLGVDDQIGHFKGCVWVHSMNRVLTPGGYLEKPDQFRVSHGGYTFMMDNQNDRTSRDAWEAFTQSQALTVARADATCFKPAILPGAIVENAGRTYVNTWWPAKVARTVGDVTPFLEHLRKILPDDRDRKIYLSYMAACVQHVGKKFAWCPVLQGAEGNGKTLFSMCVAEAVGQHYTHWIDAAGLASPFNSFLANKVFLAVEELRVAEHQEEVIRLLYGIITGGAGMQIQAKGVDQMSMEICCNLMATSNYKNAIRKTADNARRFCLLFSAQQSKADIARDGMGGDYFPRLYDWLKLQGGFAIVSELLHTYPIEAEFDPTRGMHRAPDTTATAAAIVESMGSVEQHIAEAVAAGLPGFIGGWVSTAMVDRLLEDMHMGAKISPQRRRQMLVEMGYVLHPGLPDGRCTNPVQPDGRRPQLFIRPGSGLEAIVGAAEIGRKYSMDQLTSIGVRA